MKRTKRIYKEIKLRICIYLLQEDHYQRAAGQTHYLWQSCRR